MSTGLLEKTSKLLSTFEGRDKVVRALQFVFVLTSEKSSDSLKTSFASLAAQLSSTRLVMRQLTDLPMLKASLDHLKTANEIDKTTDPVSYWLQLVTNLFYQAYFFIEHFGFLSSHKLLRYEPSKVFTLATVAYIFGALASLTKTVRSYMPLVLELREARSSESYHDTRRRIRLAQANEVRNFVITACDLITAINGLPKGILWSQKLSKTKTSLLGLIASLLGVIRIWEKL